MKIQFGRKCFLKIWGFMEVRKYGFVMMRKDRVVKDNSLEGNVCFMKENIGKIFYCCENFFFGTL